MAVSVGTRTVITSGGTSLHPARILTAAPTLNQVLVVPVTIDTTVDSSVTAVELGSAGSGKAFTRIAGPFLHPSGTLKAYVYAYTVGPADLAETQVTVTQTVARATCLGVYPLNNAKRSSLVVEATSANTGQGLTPQSPALSADVPAGDWMLAVCATTFATSMASDLPNCVPTSGWTGSGGTSAGSTPGVSLHAIDIVRAAAVTSGGHGAWSNTAAAGGRDYIAFTMHAAAALLPDIGAVEFSGSPQTVSGVGGLSRTTQFGVPGAVQLKGAQKPRPTTHDSRTLVTGPTDVNGLYFDNEVTFVGNVTGDQVGFAQPPHWTDGTHTFTNVYLDFAGGGKSAGFVTGTTVTTNVSLKYVTLAGAQSDLFTISGALVGNVDLMHYVFRPKPAAAGNPAQLVTGAAISQSGATVTIDSGAVLRTAQTKFAALHVQDSFRGVNSDPGGLVEAAVQRGATLLGALCDGGQVVHRTGTSVWHLQDHALNTTPQTYQYDKGTVTGSDQPQRRYTGTTQGRGQWQVMDLIRSKGAGTDRVLIAHGFEAFMHTAYTGGTNDATVFADPAHMQNAIDAIFQYAIDAVAWGSPITHVSVGQERKSFSSNFASTADKTINPDTQTPSGNWWQNAAWWHARFFNMLKDQRDAHSNNAVRALKLGFAHTAFGGTTDETWHTWPLGSEDGSIPPNTSNSKNDEEFVNYLLDWCRDPDFHSLDYSLINFGSPANATLAYIASHADQWGVLVRQFRKKLATRAGLSTAKRNAPLWAIEYYAWSNGASADSTFTEAQQAWGEMIVASSIVANGIEKAVKWQPMGDNFPATAFQNKSSWVRHANTGSTSIPDSNAGQATAGAGPGGAYLSYNAVLELKQNFGAGTKLVTWTTDDPDIVVVASPTRCLLINKNPTVDKKVTIVWEDRRRQYVTVPHVAASTSPGSTNAGWLSVARTPRIGSPKVNRRVRTTAMTRTTGFGVPVASGGTGAWQPTVPPRAWQTAYRYAGPRFGLETGLPSRTLMTGSGVNGSVVVGPSTISDTAVSPFVFDAAAVLPAVAPGLPVRTGAWVLRNARLFGLQVLGVSQGQIPILLDNVSIENPTPGIVGTSQPEGGFLSLQGVTGYLKNVRQLYPAWGQFAADGYRKSPAMQLSGVLDLLMEHHTIEEQVYDACKMGANVGENRRFRITNFSHGRSALILGGGHQDNFQVWSLDNRELGNTPTAEWGYCTSGGNSMWFMNGGDASGTGVIANAIARHILFHYGNKAADLAKCAQSGLIDCWFGYSANAYQETIAYGAAGATNTTPVVLAIEGRGTHIDEAEVLLIQGLLPAALNANGLRALRNIRNGTANGTPATLADLYLPDGTTPVVGNGVPTNAQDTPTSKTQAKALYQYPNYHQSEHEDFGNGNDQHPFPAWPVFQGNQLVVDGPGGTAAFVDYAAQAPGGPSPAAGREPRWKHYPGPWVGWRDDLVYPEAGLGVYQPSPTPTPPWVSTLWPWGQGS